MPTKLAEHERDLELAREKLERASIDAKRMMQEMDELTVFVRGWEAVVARERKEEGVEQSPEIPPSASADQPKDQSQPALPSTDQQSSDGDDEESGVNKTRFVRDHIQAHAATGTTPDDLKKAARVAGIGHPPSWPYGPLQRLKKKGDIVKRKGKFYPKGATNTQSNLALVG